MKIWDSFLEQQEGELGLETVNKWLRPLKVVRFDACNLYLEAKDPFHILWFEEHIRSKIKTQFVNGNQKRIKVHISVPGEPPKKRHSKNSPQASPAVARFSLSFDPLDPHCSFENFIVTEANLLPFRLLCKITGFEPSASDISELATFNPIYIHGSCGTGKTHLLMAAAKILKAKGLNVIYVRGETFTDHVVTAIRAGEMSQFRQTYRNSDVLMIDDVDIFSRKTATQEELFHTFNALHLAGKQILLTANTPPGELKLIEPRLISRFEWGVVLPLDQLKREEVGQLLEKKTRALQFPLHPKAIAFLIETFASGTKSLHRALQALMLRSHISPQQTSTQLSIPQIRHVLADLILEEEQAALTPAKIIQVVAEYFGIRSEDILGKAQTRDCVLPRQVAMFLCRSELKLSYVKIGEIFVRDHSTVMSSVKAIQKAIEKDVREISSPYHTILKKLHV